MLHAEARCHKDAAQAANCHWVIIRTELSVGCSVLFACSVRLGWKKTTKEVPVWGMGALFHPAPITMFSEQVV